MQVIMRSRLAPSVIEREKEISMPSLALNEITIDRGPSHYICNLGEFFILVILWLSKHQFRIDFPAYTFKSEVNNRKLG